MENGAKNNAAVKENIEEKSLVCHKNWTTGVQVRLCK